MVTNLPLRPGQQLAIRWRTAEGLVRERLHRLRLDGDGQGNASCHVAYVDPGGVSVYIDRYPEYGGNIAGFIPATLTWQSYFEPLAGANWSHAGSRHFTRVFPRDFL